MPTFNFEINVCCGCFKVFAGYSSDLAFPLTRVPFLDAYDFDAALFVVC